MSATQPHFLSLSPKHSHAPKRKTDPKSPNPTTRNTTKVQTEALNPKALKPFKPYAPNPKAPEDHVNLQQHPPLVFRRSRPTPKDRGPATRCQGRHGALNYSGTGAPWKGGSSGKTAVGILNPKPRGTQDGKDCGAEAVVQGPGSRGSGYGCCQCTEVCCCSFSCFTTEESNDFACALYSPPITCYIDRYLHWKVDIGPLLLPVRLLDFSDGFGGGARRIYLFGFMPLMLMGHLDPQPTQQKKTKAMATFLVGHVT